MLPICNLWKFVLPKDDCLHTNTVNTPPSKDLYFLLLNLDKGSWWFQLIDNRISDNQRPGERIQFLIFYMITFGLQPECYEVVYTSPWRGSVG